MRQQREALGASRIDVVSKQITEYIVNLNAFEAASILFLYAAFPLEVQTIYLAKEGRKRGKRIAYPKVNEKGEMIFYEVEDERELVKNKYRSIVLEEPDPVIHKPVIPQGGDLMILPGTAFDKKLNRIGYGGGFYDRYVACYPHLYKLGVCMAFQILEEVPREAFDQPLDGVVCEEGYYLPFETD